jgi:signal transduction histidine kinase
MIESYRQGQAFVVDDLAGDARVHARERATWAPGGIGALVSVGLLGNNHVTANFCVQSLPPRRWTEAQVSLVREVAERAWAAMERARAEEALKDADRHKDEFLATLAHELRNPLAPISNAVHLLRRPDGRRVTDRLMEIVERQVRQIVKLVDDLMEISRITRGKIELDRQSVDLAAAVRDDGRGIAADQLASVFDMFAQVRDPALRNGEGLGIGLALVRKLVEMHGGTVEGRSAGLGQGSEFVLRLRGHAGRAAHFGGRR